MTLSENDTGIKVERTADGRLISFIEQSDQPIEAAALLTETLFELYQFLTRAESADIDTSAVIDIQVVTHAEPTDAAVSEAFVEAVRGTMQSWVLERGAQSCPVNLIVSTAEQHADRLATLDYLLSSDGGFSRGSTTDLREVAE